MSPSTWRKWRNLTANERRIARTAISNSLSVAAQLRLRGYRPTRDAIEQTKTAESGVPVSLQDIGRVTQAVVRRLPWSPNCLERSLVLVRVIRRHSHDEPMLRLGVRRSNGGLEFHAWVEVDGRVAEDSAEIGQTFIPFGGDELPPHAVFV